MAAPFTYTRAVVRGIPDSLPAAALRMCESANPVDLLRARRQHEEYVRVIKTLVEQVGWSGRG